MAGLTASPLVVTAAISGLSAIVALWQWKVLKAIAFLITSAAILMMPKLIDDWAAWFIIPAACLSAAWLILQAWGKWKRTKESRECSLNHSHPTPGSLSVESSPVAGSSELSRSSQITE